MMHPLSISILTCVTTMGIAPKERPTKVAKENTVFYNDQDGQRSRNEGMLLKISLRSINMMIQIFKENMAAILLSYSTRMIRITYHV